MRGRMRCYPDQFVALVEINDKGSKGGAVTEAVADTGGARSLIELHFARVLGLEVQEALHQEFGTYYGPGGEEKGYVGRVWGPLTVRFSSEVVVELPELKLIIHPEPLLLLGADVLCFGKRGWSFRAIGVGSERQGLLTFSRGKRTCTLPLLNAPNASGEPTYQALDPIPLQDEGTSIPASANAATSTSDAAAPMHA